MTRNDRTIDVVWSLSSAHASVYVHSTQVHSLIQAIFTRSYYIFAGRSRSRIYYMTGIRTADTVLSAGHADDAHVSNVDDN